MFMRHTFFVVPESYPILGVRATFDLLDGENFEKSLAIITPLEALAVYSDTTRLRMDTV